MQEQGIEPMSMQQFIEQAMAEGQMSGGTPLPNDPTKPVNPFQPKPTGPVLPDRQMAAYGGIMGLDGRRKYGFGSKLKKTIRNIIPNEVAAVAEKAAPFIALAAPQFALPAALAGGLGSFDRTGKVGSSLLSGLSTYGLGQISPGLPGVRDMGPSTGMFSKTGAMGGKYNLSNIMARRSAPNSEFVPSGNKNVRLDQQPSLFGGSQTGDASIAETIAAGGKNTTIGSNVIKEQSKNLFGELPGQARNLLSKAGLGNNLVTGLLVGGLGASALMGNMEPEEIQDMQRGEGLDIEGIRTEVVEAMKDPSGEALEAIRIKYPFLGTQRSKNMAMGGRIGFNNGGGFSENDLLLLKRFKMNPKEVATYKDGGAELLKSLRTSYIPKAEGGIMDLGGMEKDYRAEGGFVPIGKAEKADDVPARLSVNEFVFTADAVRNAGGGDIDQGAEVMENMMKHLEQGGQVSEESQGMAGARDMFATSQRLSEVI